MDQAVLDGSFRFAAQQMYDSVLRTNSSIVDASGSADAMWAVSFGLLCGQSSIGQPCGKGWVNTSIPVQPVSSHWLPASNVHMRRDPGPIRVPDKIVMSHTRVCSPTYLLCEEHFRSMALKGHM